MFRLERSAIFMAEFRAQLELGARYFHPKPCMFTWAKIGYTREVAVSQVPHYWLARNVWLNYEGSDSPQPENAYGESERLGPAPHLPSPRPLPCINIYTYKDGGGAMETRK